MVAELVSLASPRSNLLCADLSNITTNLPTRLTVVTMVQILNIDTDNESEYSQEESEPEEAFTAQGSRYCSQQSRSSGATFQTYETQPATGVKTTPKIPPSFDGQPSWFEFEDLIDDWVNIIQHFLQRARSFAQKRFDRKRRVLQENAWQ